MISRRKPDADEIMRDFDELIAHATKEAPEALGQMEAYAAAQVEMESFRAFLDIIHDTPTVVTANRAT